MVRLINVFIAILFVVVSCNNIGDKVEVSEMKIEFLGRYDCANSPTMEKNLKQALMLKGIEEGYIFIDIKKLPESDMRRGYGTPTVLLNGRDIFRAPRPVTITKAFS
jgi:hypothetical protein